MNMSYIWSSLKNRMNALVVSRIQENESKLHQSKCHDICSIAIHNKILINNAVNFTVGLLLSRILCFQNVMQSKAGYEKVVNKVTYQVLNELWLTSITSKKVWQRHKFSLVKHLSQYSKVCCFILPCSSNHCSQSNYSV